MSPANTSFPHGLSGGDLTLIVLRVMAKDDTIENRVYLFESLASSFVSAAAGKLASGSDAERKKVMQALADLAFVSCVVADRGDASPEEVRGLILGEGKKRRSP